MHVPPPLPRRPDPNGALALDRPAELPPFHRFSHEAMATIYEIYVSHDDQRYAAQAARAAFDLIDSLERELSRFIPNSDVSRINALAAGERTRVTPNTIECLVIARHLHGLTGGAFDISIGTGLAALQLDHEEPSVAASRDGVRIDLGGIGKGYAVDLVGELLDEWGLTRALVHGGFSSVLALEPPPGQEGWPLTLSDPRMPSRVLARLSVTQAALGASGIRKKDHIVDPRTGVPVRARLASWALVPRPRGVADTDGPRPAAAAVTDGLTTAFMLLSHGEIAALCAGTPGLEAWTLAEAPSEDVDAALWHAGGNSGS